MSTDTTPEPAAPDAALPSAPVPAAQRRWRPRRPSFLGLVVGTLTFGAALTPSLLPRPWLFEGVIAGLGAAIGYGLGVGASWLLRRFKVGEPSARIKRGAWRALALLVPLFAIFFLLLGTGWQNEVRTIVGEPDEGLDTALIVAVVAVPVAIGAVLLGRAIRRFNGWILRLLDRWVPRAVAAVLSFALVAVVIYVAITGLLFNGFVGLMNTIYSGTNATTKPGITQPTAPERAGSSTSLATWSTLGMEGRNFVARGPSVDQLTAFSGTTAKLPVRVYVGLDTAPTAADRASLAVKELERAGGFTRRVLVVAGTTGTGWLEPQSIDSLEYEWNGDTATVGIAYSFLPSWISTLVDVDRASEAGRSLFDAVYAHWKTLPESSRPRLLAYGLSLGSFSMQSAFPSAEDLVARTQGAVFTGSPNFSQPWGTIAEYREPGSPQWKPVYRSGEHIRFAGTPSDLAQPTGPWTDTRVAYLQHANDPVVWWSPQLLFEQPDWLREPPGAGRTPTMRWYPILTFLQVTVDQFVGVDVPNGQGHNYGTSMPATWAAVTQPPGWTGADTARLEKIIEAYDIE